MTDRDPRQAEHDPVEYMEKRLINGEHLVVQCVALKEKFQRDENEPFIVVGGKDGKDHVVRIDGGDRECRKE